MNQGVKKILFFCRDRVGRDQRARRPSQRASGHPVPYLESYATVLMQPFLTQRFTVTNVATAAVRTATTNNVGEYTVQGLTGPRF